MADSSPSSASLFMPLTGDGKPVFLRDGSRCWALLFSTRGAARAYRIAAGLTDKKRANWQIWPSTGMADRLRQRFGEAGNEVVGALLDPVAASPASGTPVSLDQLTQWAEGCAGEGNPLRTLPDVNWADRCHLVARGEAAVGFLAESALKVSEVWPSWPAADGSNGDTAGFAVGVGTASEQDIAGQVADALRVLRDNRKQLSRLAGLPGVIVTLHFLIAAPKIVRDGTETGIIFSPCYFPAELVRLAAEVGLGIFVDHDLFDYLSRAAANP
jgi:hypothetical protein